MKNISFFWQLCTFLFSINYFIVQCSLDKLVEAPKVVREIDWINIHWPKVLADDL